MGRLYLATALVLVNLMLLLAITNAVIWAFLPRETPPKTAADYARAWLIDAYGFDRLARAYPDWTRGELRAFLYETSNWVNEFEPFTQFRMKPRRDRFITVGEHGFREGPDQAPWPPRADAVNVFVFGGSTTLGAGLPDHQTVPAWMSSFLRDCAKPVAIYNFGRGFFLSTQERVLFEQLLMAGHVPANAVFIDGLNDFHYAQGVPQWTTELRAMMTQTHGAPRLNDRKPAATMGEALRDFAVATPLGRLAARLNELSPPERFDPASDPARVPAFGPAMVVPESAPSSIPVDAAALDRARPAAERLEANWRMIRTLSREYGVRASFVLQPVPTHGYDLRYLNVYEGKFELFGDHVNSAGGYQLLAQRHAAGGFGADVLWLGDMTKGRHENLFVDSVHYTSAFARDVAQRIVEHLTASGTLACR